MVLSPLTACIKAGLAPIQIHTLFRWKNISFLLLTSATVPAFADMGTEVDPKFQKQLSIEQRKSLDNKGDILIIDIAKPEHDGVSDNRFTKFNVPNSAVFNNAVKEGNSQLVGHLQKNKHFDNKSAKTILSQVTGKEMSSIQGGLEVFGDRADLIIVNPNGITLNGVKAINTERFVAAAANVTTNSHTHRILRREGHHTLTTTENGKVIIGEKGVATNGLAYFDVVAKTIEQHGAVSPEKDHKDSQVANVTFAAGSLEYDLKDHKVKGKKQHVGKNTIAISGELAGAMHGKHIQFITTDTGAGVKHQGTILSESDIQIKTEQGNVDVQNLHANKKIELTGKNTKVLAKGLVRANESVKLNMSDNVTLEESAKISSGNSNINAKNLTVNANATLIAKDLTVQVTERITNDGTIAGRHNNLNTKKLVNREKGAILGEETLNITVKGKKAEFQDKKIPLLI